MIAQNSTGRHNKDTALDSQNVFPARYGTEVQELKKRIQNGNARGREEQETGSTEEI